MITEKRDIEQIHRELLIIFTTEIPLCLWHYKWLYNYHQQNFFFVCFLIIIIIIFLHGLGRLTCFQGCASLLMSTLFSLGVLPTHPQNPHSWRTNFSVLVWPLSYGLSGLEGPTRNIKVPTGIAHKVTEARKPPTTTRWRQCHSLKVMDQASYPWGKNEKWQ